MSASEALRLRFQSLVARGLAASRAASRVGLAGASEVWGGDAPRERPAWYLWLRDAPGAWQVELATAEPLGLACGSALLGRFTVRYYPASGTPERESFSAEERAVAVESLDATGTPRIERASGIPEPLFTVGSVEWALDPDSGASAFVLASLDRLRTRTESGDVVRDVPGWTLTAPVFALVAGLYAQVERRAAARLVVSRQPGFEAVLSAGGLRHLPAAERVQGAAALLFPPGEGGAAGAELLEALQEPDAEVVARVAFERGAHPPPAIDADPRLPLGVSHAWFGGEAHREDGVACAC